MDQIDIKYGRNLWCQHELLVIHPVYGKPVELVKDRLADLPTEVEKRLVQDTKLFLAKFLTVMRKSKGQYYLVGAEKQRYEELWELKCYFTRRMHLNTVQNALTDQLPKIFACIPSRKSKYYPSQLTKYKFFHAVCAFQLEQVDQLISGTAKAQL